MMTELDELRAALQEPPDFTPGSLDLDQIMVTGGRIRRRRRLAAGAAGAAAAVALFAGGSQLTESVRQVEMDRPGPPPAASPTTAAPTTPKPVAGRLGEVIPTGLKATQGAKWVIYGVPVKNRSLPRTSFGFALAEQRTDGSTTKALEAMAVDGAQLAPGFHAIEVPATLEGDVEQPAFGYFVGRPAKITGTVGGRTVVAKKVAWSYNSSVTVFWFDNSVVSGSTTLTRVAAYDATGKLLAAYAVAQPGG